MMNRIGVFICECGPTIKDAMDVPRLVSAAGRLEGVVMAEAVALLCTTEARIRVGERIRSMGINRVVFAGCSPREHEQTFREALVAAGLNPYLMQTANIREQCAWVIQDREAATRKAQALIRAAVERVRHHDPLTVHEVDCRPDVLVVGAGVAGIAAARTLAQDDRRVYLVERSACIGGKAALYEDLYPDLNCAACLIEPDLDALLHDDRIDLITLGEVEALQGTTGNFVASVRQHPRWIDVQRCIGCGACLEACPVTVPNEINANMDQRAAVSIPYAGALPHVAVIDRRHCRRFNGASCTACRDACPFDAVDYDQTDTLRELAVGAVVVATGFHGFDADRDVRYGTVGSDTVISAYAFERLVNTTGPTGGKIVTADGRPPRRVAFVHCVGSRSDAFNGYCSGVCCLYAFKHARQVLKQLPEASVHHVFADLCLPGKTAQRFFDRLRAEPGITLHRMNRPDAVCIDQENGKTMLRYTAVTGTTNAIEADLVVLATALEPPREARHLANILDVHIDPDGFFMASQPVTAPLASSREGIHLAGCCQGPTDIPTAVAQGQAAAGRILQTLVPGGTIALEPIVADVDADLCSGCRTCTGLCSFGAIVPGEENAAVTIQPTMCRGCGICAAACPAGAITICHFSGTAVAAEIDGLLKPDKRQDP